MIELRMDEPADIEIYLRDKGMVLKEKSLVAYTPSDGKILAFGDEAEEIAGKNMEDVQVISPLRQGMVANYSAAVKMFQYMIERVVSESKGKELENYRNTYTVEMKGQKMRYFETNMESG